MEIDIKKMYICHIKDKIHKVYDNSEEALAYCELAKNFGSKMACDPLYAFLEQIKTKGAIEENRRIHKEE